MPGCQNYHAKLRDFFLLKNQHIIHQIKAELKLIKNIFI